MTRNLIAGFLAVLALAALFTLARGTPQPASLQDQSMPADPAEAQIVRLRQALGNNELSEEGRKNLEEKLAMAERMATEQAAARQKRGGKNLPKNPPPLPAEAMEAESSQPFLEGVFEGSQGLIRPSLASVENMWQGQRDDTSYQVFAGSLPNDPVQGLLLVIVMDPNRPTGSIQAYPAPKGVSALHILEVTGTLVQLESSEGRRIAFDLGTRQFQD